MRKFIEEHVGFALVTIATAILIVVFIFINPGIADSIKKIAGDWSSKGTETDTVIILTPSHFTYDGSAKTPDVKVKLRGDEMIFDEDYTYAFTDNVNAGKAKITVTYKGDYRGTVIKRFTINPATITVSAPRQEYVYNGSPQGQPLAFVTVNSQPGTVQYGETNGVYTITGLANAPKYTNAGTYNVFYKITAPNHNPVTGKYQIFIDKAKAAVVTAPTARNLTYNRSGQSLINPGTASGGMMEYKVGTTGTWKTSIPAATNAGTYTVYYRVKGDSNHYNSDTGSITVTINKANNTLGFTANSGTITYPSASTTQFTVNANTAGTSLSVASANSNIATASISGTRVTVTFKGAGTTTISVTSAGNSNYNATSKNYTITCKYNTYTVRYNGNGATSGSMSDQAFTYNSAQNLRSNTFKKTGYVFKGWSTSSYASSPTYTDGQSVNNLTSTNGGVVTLYAVWKQPFYYGDNTSVVTGTSYYSTFYKWNGSSNATYNSNTGGRQNWWDIGTDSGYNHGSNASLDVLNSIASGMTSKTQDTRTTGNVSSATLNGSIEQTVLVAIGCDEDEVVGMESVYIRVNGTNYTLNQCIQRGYIKPLVLVASFGGSGSSGDASSLANGGTLKFGNNGQGGFMFMTNANVGVQSVSWNGIWSEWKRVCVAPTSVNRFVMRAVSM